MKAAALLVALTLGFVMPGSSLIKRLALNRDDQSVTELKMEGLASLKPLVAREVAKTLSPTWTNGDLSLSTVLSVRYPGRCRMDVASPDAQKTLSLVWANGKKRFEGGESPTLMLALEHACSLLTPRSAGAEIDTREYLNRYLAGVKVDTKATSLGRIGAGFAIVLGQRTENAAQLWVSKERFVPLRLKFADDKGQFWQLQFTDYTSASSGEWWPRVLDLYKGADLVARISVLSGDGKAELDNVKF